MTMVDDKHVCIDWKVMKGLLYLNRPLCDNLFVFQNSP